MTGHTYVLDQLDAVSATRQEGNVTVGHATVTAHFRDDVTGQRVQVQGLPYGTDADWKLGARYVIKIVSVA